jgi:hypothetical protein
MPQTSLRLVPAYLFEVPNDEMLLILKALGGRLASDEQREAARLLGDRLTEQRARELENQAAKLREAMK